MLVQSISVILLLILSLYCAGATITCDILAKIIILSASAVIKFNLKFKFIYNATLNSINGFIFVKSELLTIEGIDSITYNVISERDTIFSILLSRIAYLTVHTVTQPFHKC